jgi:hypothetical protein
MGDTDEPLSDDEVEALTAEGEQLERTDNGPRPDDGDQPDWADGKPLPPPEDDE